MQCPKCGSEYKEGHLYCDECGHEIQIVPVFEPEIENSIQENLSGIAEGLDGKKRQKKKTLLFNRKLFPSSFGRMLVAAAALVLCCGSGVFWYLNNSYQFQLSKAKKAAQDGDFAQAIIYLDHAIDLNGEDLDAKLLLADYYSENAQPERAEIMLREVISLDASNKEAYRKLIAIYEADVDYGRINRILLENGTKDVLQEFSSYIALAPEFSYADGRYDEVIPLKLSSNTTGTIYYTMDGSMPNMGSEVYTSPIFLENGMYSINAIFVNDKGVASECAFHQYVINVAVPVAPQINLESGSYTQPLLIEVQIPEGCKVYYTADGTEPTQNSIPYVMPISMPIGESTFAFVAYSVEGIAGEVAVRNYTLHVETLLTVESAVSLLVKGLADRGVILDFDGSVPNRNGHNSYISSTLISSGTRIYYLIVEYYADATGTSSKTGNMYAVDADSGILHKATVDEAGNYKVTPI